MYNLSIYSFPFSPIPCPVDAPSPPPLYRLLTQPTGEAEVWYVPDPALLSLTHRIGKQHMAKCCQWKLFRARVMVSQCIGNISVYLSKTVLSKHTDLYN